MVSIIDPRSKEVITANSMSSLLHKIMNDNKSRSVPTNTALLVSKGFDLTTLTDDGKHTRSNRAPKGESVKHDEQVFNILKSIVSQVDAVKIKEVKDEISRIANEEDVMDVKVGKRIKALKEQLTLLNTPLFTRENMISQATLIIDKFMVSTEPQAQEESSK
jgi:uncharacterized protein (UPF0147 family)